MKKRDFYKTVITIEVLSEDPLDSNMSLSDLDYFITDGDGSGLIKPWKRKKINGKQAAKELMKQGSDPSFFQIDEKGEDINEED